MGPWFVICYRINTETKALFGCDNPTNTNTNEKWSN